VIASGPPLARRSARDDERAEKTTEILKKIRTLEIKTRGLVETAFAGDYHSVFKGRGMNFSRETKFARLIGTSPREWATRS
jgi:hypothetical protein